MTVHYRALLFVLTLIACGVPAEAQSFLLEGGVGAGRFTESAGFDHAAGSGGARWFINPQLSVGPEVVYLEEGNHHDVLVTGNVTWDFKPSGVTPYVVGGAGLFRQTTTLSLSETMTETFTSTEGSITGGVGIRIPFAGGWYVAPEARAAWEPHVRLQVLAGYRWR